MAKHDGAAPMTMRTLLVDVAIAAGLVGLAWAVAVFSQGPGIRFVYFAF